MLKVFFTIVYFLIFLFFIDLIFRNTLSGYSTLVARVCWSVAFIVSVGIADYTVKKIKEKYKK